MAEVEVGGVKLSGGKGMAIMMGIGSLIGTLYGGFEVYKDYMDMKAKLANLEPEAIQQQIDVAMIKLDEGVSYAKDIKNDLRSDVIQIEKALGDVEQRIRDTESENRVMVKEAQRWFDDRTQVLDTKLVSLEDRLNKRITQALTNALEGDQ
jgi:hypothetical protein